VAKSIIVHLPSRGTWSLLLFMAVPGGLWLLDFTALWMRSQDFGFTFLSAGGLSLLGYTFGKWLEVAWREYKKDCHG
jgi:hypothetical protein